MDEDERELFQKSLSVTSRSYLGEENFAKVHSLAKINHSKINILKKLNH